MYDKYFKCQNIERITKSSRLKIYSFVSGLTRTLANELRKIFGPPPKNYRKKTVSWVRDQPEGIVKATPKLELVNRVQIISKRNSGVTV